jgi:hypothetical protein
MAESGYVLAGFETLATIVDNFFKGKRGRWNENFTRQEIATFLAKKCSGYLHSYGQNFANKKKYEKYNATEANMYKICRDMRIFDGCTMIADSGGFQISIGRLTRKESDLLRHMYYDWIEEYHEVLDKAFILDIPPGPGCEIFHNFYDVYKLNLESYERAKALPDDIRKKIIYIHHFRTPELWDIYTKIMRDNEMFPAFEYHGTGGIVANMSSDMVIPCIIYVLPIIPLLNETKKYGRDYLNFHVLGGANWRDIFFYELLQAATWRYHKIKLNITYDSSGIYKQVMHARYMHVIDGKGNMRKMNIKSDNLECRFYDDPLTDGNAATVEQTYQKVLDETAKQHNFKPISLDGVYSEETNTFHEDVKVYSILYTLGNFATIQSLLRDFVREIYPYHEAGDEGAFYKECLKVTRFLNQGKITKKQKAKAHSISKSLDMIKSLDEDYCEYLVRKYLSKDEFINLQNKGGMLEI